MPENPEKFSGNETKSPLVDTNRKGRKSFLQQGTARVRPRGSAGKEAAMMQSPHQDKTPAANRLVYKNIELDPAAGQVLRAGRPVALSPKERCLLAFLLTHRGQAFTREELLACVWDVTTPQRTRTVDMHIRQLRRKLGPELDIVTVFKVGYRLN